MNVLITGAAGFVGRYLIDELMRGHNKSAAGGDGSAAGGDGSCNITVTKLPGETINTNHPVGIADIDITDAKEVEKIFDTAQFDAIIHLAAQSSAVVSWQNPVLTAQVNIIGTINILEALQKTKYKGRILLIGSSDEYGKIARQENPVREDAAIKPLNIYAITKVCQNMLGKLYIDAYGLDIVMARAFGHTGPGQSETFVVSDFCKQAAQIETGMKEPVIYTGNLSVCRDFTDVRDVVKAYTSLLKSGKTGETYNVGSGRSIAISEILDMIIAESPADIKTKIDETKFRPSDTDIIEADITKIKNDTGWSPRIDLKTSIKDTLQYWREILCQGTVP